MRRILAVSVLSVLSTSVLAQSSSPVVDREWYTGLKRVAKYVRVAIVTQRSMTATDVAAFSRDARSAMSAAEALSLPENQKTICRNAASAVVDIIDTAAHGSALGGRATVSDHFARWERLGDQCLTAINGR